MGESVAIFNKRKKYYISRDKESKLPSVLQESFFDTIPFYFTKEIFYIPIVGNLYYRGIGISIKTNKLRKKRIESQIEYYNSDNRHNQKGKREKGI